SRSRFVTRYAYHHGYFDGEEREFRGFGMVEHWDTDEIGNVPADELSSGAANLDAASYAPPIHTKTWFHTGVYLEEGRISKHFEDEYFWESDAGDPAHGLSEKQARPMLLDDTVLPDAILQADGTKQPYQLSQDEVREACRALKGSVLRQEIYAL